MKENTKENNVKKKTLSSRILLIFRIISVIVIIGCVAYIINWAIENKNNSTMIHQISESSIIDTMYIEIPENPDNPNDTVEDNTIPVQIYELDFDKLLGINKSTVGWIKVPNSTIDYPVVKGTDNSFYLNHSFDNSRNSAGWIFADYRNKFDGTDKNIIIYGHNRMDASMFATLGNSQKPDWYNNPVNKYITLTTPSGNYIYQVFSVYTIKAESFYTTTYFPDDNSFLNFINVIKNRSIHDFGVNISSNDSILTLSTCDASGKNRVVLHAKKVIY